MKTMQWWIKKKYGCGKARKFGTRDYEGHNKLFTQNKHITVRKSVHGILWFPLGQMNTLRTQYLLPT
jgi:hypothetical protein